MIAPLPRGPAEHGPQLPLPPRPRLHRQLSNRAATAWDNAQVERHGQYSLSRLEELYRYEQTTPLWRVLLVCSATPALAVLLIILTDWMPLQDPTRGLSYSHLLWLRAFITIFCVSGPTLLQLRFVIPKLKMTLTEAFVLTVLSSAAAVATQFGLANVIGYPVPFGLVLGTPACFVVLVVGVTVPRKTLLQQVPKLRQQLKDYVAVWICQIGFTVIYPVYNYFFSQLSSHAQTAFVLLLPVLKLANKNWINYSLRDTDDLKPEVAVFNVEVFHALYVAVCMQSSTSLNTTLALMAIDFLQAWLSIREISHVLKEVLVLLVKVPARGRAVSSELVASLAKPPTDVQLQTRQQRTILDAAIDALAEDAPLRRHNSLRQTCFANLSTKSRRSSAVVSTPTITPVGPTMPIRHAHPIPRRSFMPFLPSLRVHSSPKAVDGPRTDSVRLARPHEDEGQGSSAPGLSAAERLELVQKTLNLLFVTEFVALVEYTEVIVPLIFNVCFEGMIRLPNREFYLPLAGKTDAQLRATFANVALYGCLEFLSFVAFALLLRWKLRFSVLTQVAFVLEKQFVMVQSKLVMWTFYVLQTSLRHFGADLSFSFSWLHGNA